MKTALPPATLKLVTHNFRRLLEIVARCCRIVGALPGSDKIIPYTHTYNIQAQVVVSANTKEFIIPKVIFAKNSVRAKFFKSK